MRGFTAAWLAGMAIVVWKQVNQQHKLPVPGALAGVTGLFAALAIIADVVPQSRRVVTIAAFGLDLAGLLGVLPAGLSGQISTSANVEQEASGGQSAQSSAGARPAAV